MPREKFLARLTLGFIYAIGILFPIGSAIIVRPIGDDYCYVVSVRNLGIVGFALEQTQEWSGAAITNAVAAVFGALQVIDFRLANLVLFSVTILLTYLVLARVTRSVMGQQDTTPFPHIFAFGTASGLTFLAFGFGFPASLSQPEFAFGYATAFWAASSMSQYLPTLVLVLLTTILLRQGLAGNRAAKRWPLMVGTLVVPLMSLQAGLAWVLLLSLLSLRVRKRGWSLSLQQMLLLIFVGLLMLSLNAFTSGSQNRKSLAETSTYDQILQGTRESLLLSLDSLISGLTLIAVVMGVFTGFLLSLRPPTPNSSLRIYAYLAACVLIATTLSDAIGAFEPWHQVGLRFVTYCLGYTIGLFMAASILHNRMRNSNQGLGIVLRVWIVLIWILAFTVQVGALTNIGVARSQSWADGRAFRIDWIADREVSWIQHCANQALPRTWVTRP